MNKNDRWLGAHTSIAGGLHNALIAGHSIGCTCVQLFTKGNRQWHARSLSEDEITLFQQTANDLAFSPERINAHAGYLLNISAPGSICTKSIKSLIDEVERCHHLAIPTIVFHPGSRLTNSPDVAIKTIARSLNTICKQTPHDVTLAIEMMAGQGSSMCSTLPEVAEIYQLCTEQKRIGVCVDTCHVFAAGYDISAPDTYEEFWTHFNHYVGLKNLAVIHMNDSKRECGSHVDRHEDIGKGKIGLPGFKLIMNDTRFVHIPKILETPETTDSLKDYARNLRVLKKLVK